MSENGILRSLLLLTGLITEFNLYCPFGFNIVRIKCIFNVIISKQ